jgi:hypothetical protein
MEKTVLEYHREARRRWQRYRRLLWAGFAVVVLVYGAGYARLRAHRDLVHFATGYSGAGGKWIRTDRIDLGERRWGRRYVVLCLVYWPAREMEAAAWRWMPDQMDALKLYVPLVLP